jgi:hypothetical protein
MRRFFTAFRDLDLRDLDEGKVQKLLDAHKLGTDDFAGYAETPRQL